MEGHKAHFDMMLGDYQYESPIQNNNFEDNLVKSLDEIQSGIAQVAISEEYSKKTEYRAADFHNTKKGNTIYSTSLINELPNN